MPRKMSPQEKQITERVAAKLDILYYYDDNSYQIYRDVLTMMGYEVRAKLESGITYHQVVPSKEHWLKEK